MKLQLRRPERDDLDALVDWMGDSEFRLFLFGDSEPKALHMGQQMLGVMGSVMSSPMSAAGNLLIESPERGPVGIITLQEVSWRNRYCYVSLYLVEQFRDLGDVETAVRAMFTYCFNELNMHRTAIRFEADRLQFVAACESVGAKREFTMPGHMLKDGKAVDILGYGLLKSEFDAARTNGVNN